VARGEDTRHHPARRPENYSEWTPAQVSAELARRNETSQAESDQYYGEELPPIRKDAGGNHYLRM